MDDILNKVVDDLLWSSWVDAILLKQLHATPLPSFFNYIHHIKAEPACANLSGVRNWSLMEFMGENPKDMLPIYHWHWAKIITVRIADSRGRYVFGI